MFSDDLVIHQLRRAGYRITEPRRAVIRALLDDGGHLSAAEIHQRAQQYWPTVGLVTVYRTLELLTAVGSVRRIHGDGGCHGYAVSSTGHRHHLVCQRCGAAVEFDGCDLSPLLTRISEETGYDIVGHLLELAGICSGCRQPGEGNSQA